MSDCKCKFTFFAVKNTQLWDNLGISYIFELIKILINFTLSVSEETCFLLFSSCDNLHYLTIMCYNQTLIIDILCSQ